MSIQIVPGPTVTDFPVGLAVSFVLTFTWLILVMLMDKVCSPADRPEIREIKGNALDE